MQTAMNSAMVGNRTTAIGCQPWQSERGKTVGSYAALTVLVGERIEAETRDGGMRRGLLSGIVWESVQVDGQDLQTPVSLHLNNEPGDYLPWRQLLRIRRL
jgi:hypothetical protein